MLAMYFSNVKDSAAVFYILAGVTQFFFSGFNTAIYAIIPDCVEYGEWKTGLRNDGFQYAFVSIMKHAFTTIPGILWIVTAVVLFFYRLNKKRYNEIVEDLKQGKKAEFRQFHRGRM